jgi:hypothetical protein
MYKKLRVHVHNRVLVQLIIFALVSVALLISVAFDAMRGDIGLGLVVVGLGVGVIVGYFVGKIFRLAWHEDTRKVVMSLDKMSFVLIGLYIVFRIFGDQVLGHYLQGAALTALTFTFLSGLLFGRLFSIWRGVVRIFREQGIL